LYGRFIDHSRARKLTQSALSSANRARRLLLSVNRLCCIEPPGSDLYPNMRIRAFSKSFANKSFGQNTLDDKIAAFLLELKVVLPTSFFVKSCSPDLVNARFDCCESVRFRRNFLSRPEPVALGGCGSAEAWASLEVVVQAR
jgi:hypothetical protein